METVSMSKAVVRHIPREICPRGTVAAGETMLKKIFERMPEKLEGFIDFESDIWDFNPFCKYSNGHSNKIRFKRFDKAIAYYVKAYVLNMIDNYTKPSTISARIQCLASTFKKIIDLKGYNSVFMMNTNDVVRVLSKSVTATCSRSAVNAKELIRFLDFISEKHQINLAVDIRKIQFCYRYFMDITAKVKSKQRYANIPKPLYDASIQMYNDVMRNSNLKLTERMTAGLFLIASQTGLRASELVALDKNPLRHLETDEGEKMPYIVYNCVKAGKGYNGAKKVVTFCTPLARRTIEYMQELRKRCDIADKSEFLYAIADRSKRINEHPERPAPKEVLYLRHANLFSKYLREMAMMDWKKLKKREARDTEYTGVKYTVPSAHNYRVHFATELTHQGYPMDFIECVMSHSYFDDMAGYYCREEIDEKKVNRAWEQIHNPETQDTITNIIYARERNYKHNDD